MNTAQPRFDYFIEDMIGAMKQLLHYTEGIDYNSFASNPMLRDAVIRNFEVIGECVKHIPFRFQNKHNLHQKKQIPIHLCQKNLI